MSASANHLPPLDPPSGPSRPKPSPRRRSSSIRPPNSSPCEIVKTSSTPPAGHNTPDLLEGDLLGSFDDFKSSEASLPAGHVHPGGQKHEFDLLGGEMWSESPSTNHARPPDAARSRPIHINLPPRPSEISPDYAPPLRSPRRASPSYSVPGPGSPPLLSEAGRDIIFHPILDTPRDDSHIDLIKFRQRGNPRSESNGHSNELHDTPVDTSQLRSAAHSTLLNALATTTKLANKWKSVLEPVVDASPAVHDRYPRSLHHTELGGRSLTALPIDITHFSPFASAEQVAGSHIAPTGAPGYDPQLSAIFNHTRNSEDDFTGTRLLGRREGTYEVLSHSNADKVRACPDQDLIKSYLHQVRKQLPPRQRLSAMWTLLCKCSAETYAILL